MSVAGGCRSFDKSDTALLCCRLTQSVFFFFFLAKTSICYLVMDKIMAPNSGRVTLSQVHNDRVDSCTNGIKDNGAGRGSPLVCRNTATWEPSLLSFTYLNKALFYLPAVMHKKKISLKRMQEWQKWRSKHKVWVWFSAYFGNMQMTGLTQQAALKMNPLLPVHTKYISVTAL